MAATVPLNTPTCNGGKATVFVLADEAQLSTSYAPSKAPFKFQNTLHDALLYCA